MDEYIALPLILGLALYFFGVESREPNLTALLVMLDQIIPWPHLDVMGTHRGSRIEALVSPFSVT